MSAYAILVGFKGGAQEAVLVDDPAIVKLAFKEEVTKGSKCKFDAVEVIDTRTGRIKRWRNTKPAPEPKGKASPEPK
jgi:hypothetical protein